MINNVSHVGLHCTKMLGKIYNDNRMLTFFLQNVDIIARPSLDIYLKVSKRKIVKYSIFLPLWGILVSPWSWNFSREKDNEKAYLQWKMFMWFQCFLSWGCTSLHQLLSLSRHTCACLANEQVLIYLINYVGCNL